MENQNGIMIDKTFKRLSVKSKATNSLKEEEPRLPFLRSNINHRVQNKKSLNQNKDHRKLNTSAQYILTEGNEILPQEILLKNNLETAYNSSKASISEKSEKRRFLLKPRIKPDIIRHKRAESQPMQRDSKKDLFKDKILAFLMKPTDLSQKKNFIRGRSTSNGDNLDHIKNQEIKYASHKDQKYRTASLLNGSNQISSWLTQNQFGVKLDQNAILKQKRNKLKSASLGNSKKKGRLFVKANDYTSQQNQSRDSSSDILVKLKTSSTNTVLGKAERILCEDDDSSDESNYSAFLNNFHRKTEGDETEYNHCLRVTADFGEKCEDLLSQSLIVQKSSKKALNRYSDITIEIEGLNHKNGVGAHDLALSFGDQKSSRNINHISFDIQIEKINGLNLFNKSGLNHSRSGDKKHNHSENLESGYRFSNLKNEQAEQGSHENDQNLNVFNKNKLQIREKDIYEDSFKTMHQKRSTPNFALSKHGINAY